MAKCENMMDQNPKIGKAVIWQMFLPLLNWVENSFGVTPNAPEKVGKSEFYVMYFDDHCIMQILVGPQTSPT